jgi:hypothetical protein
MFLAVLNLIGIEVTKKSKNSNPVSLGVSLSLSVELNPHILLNQSISITQQPA